MTHKPISVKPDTTIDRCSKIMLKKHVGSLLIMKNGELQGIITEQDIVRKVVAVGLDPYKTKVKQVMVTNLLTIDPDSDIYDAIVIMKDRNIRHLPVINKSKMIGYLTLKDILKIEPQLFDIMVERFELREEEHKPVFGEEPNPAGICEMCDDYSERLLNIDGIMYCASCKPKQ